MTQPTGAQPPSEPTPAPPADPTPPAAVPDPIAPPADRPTAEAPAAPAYPTAPSYPVHPTAQVPAGPAYPTAEAPAYPTGPAITAPDYPIAPASPGPAPAPAYPAAPRPSAAEPPTYPTGPTPAPGAPTPPEAAPTPTPPEAQHPHHISTEQRRVHLTAHQRGADATAIGNLLLYLPHFLASLFVVGLVSLLFGGLALVFVLLWLLSGVLIFHRPTESAIARRLLRLRHPTPQERARLEPVWREVTARAGVEGSAYELWVEDSDALNAVAAAGHIVGVTRFAMNRLPNGELAAVLAHELGHHVGGHAWSSLLGYWYALPGRLAWRLMRGAGRVVYKVSRVFSCFGVGFVLLVFGAFAFATISTLYGLPLLILVVPYALAAVSRRAELRADQHAAALGFAPMLASVLDKLHQADQQQQLAAKAYHGGVAPQEPSALAKLLSSHPDHHTRLHRLQPYLRPPSRQEL